MTILETAVADLANALENLESRLEGRFGDQSNNSEEWDAAQRQAQSARAHAGEASRDLSKIIIDLKTLLDETAPGSKD